MIMLIDELTTITNTYIHEHQSELRLQLLSFSQHNLKNSTELETIIAENLLDYINDEHFLSLPIFQIYRILTLNKNQQMREKTEYTEFLFKCIDKFGMKASILFQDINFDKLPSKYQQMLLTEYSEKFDFHFINPSFTKSTYQMANDLLIKTRLLNEVQQNIQSKFKEQEEEHEKKVKELNDQINQAKKELNSIIQEQKKSEENIKKQVLEEVSKVKEELNQKNIQLTNDINYLKDKMLKMNTVYDMVYPIGSIYMSVNNINPINLFGGEWISWGQGRVPVGVNSSGNLTL